MGQSMAGVPAHLARVHQHRQRAMRRGVVMLLLHGGIVGLSGALMEDRWSCMVNGASMVMGSVSVGLLALVARMRVLW